AIVGLGNGLALGGKLPVCEIMFGDFLTLAADQLINHASKFRYMYNDQVRVPLIVRTPMGGGRGYGPTHSQSLEKHFLGLPQTQMLALHQRCNPGSVYDTLFETVDRPVLVIENKLLYATRMGLPAPEGFTLEASDELYPTTRLKPAEKPEITVFCYGGMLGSVEQAIVSAFEEHEIVAEVICPIQLYPFNPGAVIESVSRTRRLLLVEEGAAFAALGAEVIAQIVEQRPGILQRVMRVGPPRHPIPSCGPLEKELLPNQDTISAAMKDSAGMNEPTPITIPLENVNDDTVKLTAWLVEDGQEVREGQPLAEIETSKALFEMSASTSGRVRLQARAGDELAVGAIIGYIGADASFALPENAPAAVESAPSTEGVRFSKKAQQLLNEHKIDAAVFQGRGMVRESDVLDYLQEKQRSGRDVSGLHVGLRDIPISGVTLPAIFHEKDRGRVDPAFLAEIRAGRDVFARLSSEEKCRKYREHGAEIGEGTTLGANTVILAPRIVLGPRVRIAENSSIDCRERFAAGQYTTFQGGLTVKGGTVAIGENVYAG